MASETIALILPLFGIFLAAKVVGGLASLVRIPSVVGEILAGVILGNTFLRPMLGLDGEVELLRAMAELGVIFLIFVVGLETPMEEMRKVGKTSTYVAILGVVIPFVAGYFLMTSFGPAFGFTEDLTIQGLFLGAALVATSVGITARVLADLGVIGGREARIIVGAAVIDDILGLTILTVVEAVGSGGSLELVAVGLLIVQAGLFVLLLMFFGGRLARGVLSDRNPLARRWAWAAPSGALFPIAVIVCLGLSVVAGAIGLAGIIGAFLAGMAFAGSPKRHELIERFEGIVRFTVPFFFGYIGLQIDLAVAATAWKFALLVTVVALLTKVVGCGIGAWGLGRRSAVAVGIGMMPRGEVGIIVALIGLTLNVIPENLYAVVVAMSLATTIVTPPLLVWAFKRIPGATRAPA